MNETRATRYQRLKRRAGAAALASAGVVLALVALTPVGLGLAGLAIRAVTGLTDPAHGTLALAVFVTFVVVIWEGATLPATLYLARHVEGRYGPATLSVDDVLAAHFRAAAVAVPAAFAVAAIVVSTRLVFAAWWWLPAAASLVLLRAAAVAGGAGLLTRVAAARPIPRPELVVRLAALAVRARVPVAGILEWTVDDATTAALVSGTGRSRRVFVSSTLVRDWTDDEVAVVVAHELAHHKYHDLWRTLALDAVVIASMFAATALVVPVRTAAGLDLVELASLPRIGLAAGAAWLAATPLRLWQSRRHERRADVFALALTGEAAAFGAAIRRLGDRHLAEERPSVLVRWFYHRHPSVTERLALAEAYERVRNAV